jgi:hypothetical protein
MKFKVYMKDPDSLYEAITEALNEELKDMPEDEASALREVRHEKASSVAGKWFEYGEYLTVEIDTEAGTCTVCEANHAD